MANTIRFRRELSIRWCALPRPSSGAPVRVRSLDANLGFLSPVTRLLETRRGAPLKPGFGRLWQTHKIRDAGVESDKARGPGIMRIVELGGLTRPPTGHKAIGE